MARKAGGIVTRTSMKELSIYKMTQHRLPLSRLWPSLPPVLPPFAASSSSIMSAGRTDMCTTFGFSALKWYSGRILC